MRHFHPRHFPALLGLLLASCATAPPYVVPSGSATATLKGTREASVSGFFRNVMQVAPVQVDGRWAPIKMFQTNPVTLASGTRVVKYSFYQYPMQGYFTHAYDFKAGNNYVIRGHEKLAMIATLWNTTASPERREVDIPLRR